MAETLDTIAEVPSARALGYDRLAGRPLGEILVALGACTPEQIDEAVEAQSERPGTRIGEILVDLKHIEPADVSRGLGVQLEIPVIDAIQIDQIPDEFPQAVPIAFAKQNQILPISRIGDSILAAVADPLVTEALDDLALLLGARISPVIVPTLVITEAINRVYDRATGLAHEAVQRLQTDDDEDADIDAIDLIDEAGTDDAPIIRFVNALLRDAVKIRASDIHVECYERHVVVRNRIDGILYKKVEAPKQAQASIIARVKIMAGLNIAEKRLPQDGRIRRKIAGKDIDVRVSTIPTAHGERVVMRILDRSSVLLSLEDLGFDAHTFHAIGELIERPHGIILVCGPTGSGKTTTLYAALSKINRPDINILTVEDPVEYQLPGVGQMQVNPKIELTFASGLRAFLRQDPDVIMVGEIRDKETAEIAIQASLTGHLVLSTVHTNDAAGATTRLVDMGIEPFLVASSLIAVLAQRLVRTLCKQCKQPYVPTAAELSKLSVHPTASMQFFKEIGCAACLNTGYQGRSGIYELLLLNDHVRQLILKNADSGAIKRAAVAGGMKTLLDDGARKMTLGLTTPEEVLRVAADEEIVVEV
ncbi:MAG: type II secretion system ATPase GspE [Deltaproteobacteria bacterium]|nr:type II secretion system ATPase GspE [Deltaproteobacteria bacterium]